MKVTIVGAGFSGLTTAYYLVKESIRLNKELSIEILDKASAPGGLLGAGLSSQNATYESAANGLLNSVEFVELCKDLEIELVKTAPLSKNRYIWIRNKARKFPFSLYEFAIVFCVFVFGFFKNFLSKQQGLKRWLKPREFETVHDWGTRLGGRFLVSNLLEPAFRGVFAIDSKQLSARLLFKTLSGSHLRRLKINQHESAKALGYSTVSPKWGMKSLIDSLEKYLRNSQRVDIKYNSLYQHEKPLASNNTATLICVDLNSVLKIFRDSETVIRNSKLYPLSFVSLCSATLCFDQNDSEPKGFGVLFSNPQDTGVMGVVMNSINFPFRYTGSSETFIYREDKSLSENELLDKLLNCRKLINPHSQSKLQTHKIYRWPNSLPCYDTSLEKWIYEGVFEKLQKEQDLILHGNYLGELSLSKILARSKTIADTILTGAKDYAKLQQH